MQTLTIQAAEPATYDRTRGEVAEFLDILALHRRSYYYDRIYRLPVSAGASICRFRDLLPRVRAYIRRLPPLP